MAGPFGRGSSNSTRFHSVCSSCTSNKKRKREARKRFAVLPTRKIKCPPLKAGRGKAQQGPPESGSSKKSSSSLSSPSPSSSSAKPKPSSEFKACSGRGRRRRRRIRAKFPITEASNFLYPKSSLSSKLANPSTTSRPPTFVWRFRYCSDSTSTAATEKAFLFSFVVFNSWRTEHRICKKNGGEPPPPPSIDVVEIGDKEQHRRRDRRGSRRPHYSLHWPERPTQQGLYRQRPQRPTSQALCSHGHTVLRRPGPPRLRPTQQSRRLAHQESQGRHRRACRAASMEPNFFKRRKPAYERGQREGDWDSPLRHWRNYRLC